VNWVWQAGGEILDQAAGRCLLGEPAAIQGLRFAQDLVVTHRVAASAEDLADQEELDMFVGGRLATYFGSRGTLGAICEAPFRFDAAIVPMGRVRMVRTNVGPTVLWSGSKNKEAAFELMRFICSSEGQQLKISSGYAFPSRKSAAAEPWFTEFGCGQSTGTGINLAFREQIEQGWARTWPTHPRWPEISTAITKEIDALYLGDKSPEQVGQDATRAVDEILARPA
jgi:multiple sugar transport system substrate-binding protein